MAAKPTATKARCGEAEAPPTACRKSVIMQQQSSGWRGVRWMQLADFSCFRRECL